MSITTIVIGIDGSENAAHAVAWTADLAARLDADVVAVHAFEPLAHLGSPPPIDFPSLADEAERDLRERWCEPFREAGVSHEARVADGDPAAVLVDTADEVDADLIVIGARGKSRLARLVLGSTSLKVAQGTRRPVAIIHLPD